MRPSISSIAAAGLLAAGVLHLGACDATQPLQEGARPFTIRVVASAPVHMVDIWDWWVDDDGDGNPDRQVGFNCIPQSAPIVAAFIPWYYSAELTLIRAGTTEELTVATSLGTPNPFSNRTPADETIVQSLADFRDGPNIYLNGRRVTQGSADYIENCLGIVLAPANILGEPETFGVELEPGDTVILRARKQLVSASPYSINEFNQLPTLRAEAFLDGQPVAPVAGNQSSDETDGSGFTFVFTSE